MQDDTRPKADGATGARRWAGALVLGGTLAAFGAAVLGLSLRASSSGPGPAATTIGREPRELHPAGDFRHPAGFPMPERVGSFERVDVAQYDDAGVNLSAGYNRVSGGEGTLPIVATVYVYPVRAGAGLDAYFDRLLDDIGQQHGRAKPEFRKNVLVANERFVGRYAIFGYEEPWGGSRESIPLRSYVLLYQWKSWWVKWRVTTPAPEDGERMGAIVELTETLLPPEEASTPGER